MKDYEIIERLKKLDYNVFISNCEHCKLNEGICLLNDSGNDLVDTADKFNKSINNNVVFVYFKYIKDIKSNMYIFSSVDEVAKTIKENSSSYKKKTNANQYAEEFYNSDNEKAYRKYYLECDEHDVDEAYIITLYNNTKVYSCIKNNYKESQMRRLGEFMKKYN